MNLPVLLYDSECTLCTRFKQSLERLSFDLKLNYLSIHDEEIKNLPLMIDTESLHSEVHLIDSELNIYKGPEVINYLAKHIKGIKRIAWLLETNVGKKASEFFYKKVNELRDSQLKSDCPKCKKKH